MRFLCKVSSVENFSGFPATTALQRYKLLVLRSALREGGLADFSPPYRFIRRRQGFGGQVCLIGPFLSFQFAIKSLLDQAARCCM